MATRTMPSMASRSRTKRPDSLPSAAWTGSISDPPSRWNGSSSAAVPPGGMTSGGRSIMRSTASSHSTWDVPSTSRASTGPNADPREAGDPPVSRASTLRRCVCRHRTRTRRTGSLASAARVEETLGPGRPPLGAVRLTVEPGGEHAPLKAHLVLAGGRPIGVEDVPLVEDRVGHRSRRFEAVQHGPHRGLRGSSGGCAHGRSSPASLRSWAKA